MQFTYTSMTNSFLDLIFYCQYSLCVSHGVKTISITETDIIFEQENLMF